MLVFNLLAFYKQSNDAMSTVSFSVGERVLCYHGPLIYESKILKGEVWDEANTKLETVGPHYLVHYKGWKQTCVSAHISPSLVFLISIFFVGSWDEWVPTARLLKYNEANLSLQKDLSRAQAAVTSASASASKTSNTARGAQAGGGRRKEGGRGTKRGRDDDDGTRRPEMRLVVPDTLKVLLVDDWEAVTKNNQVCPLLVPAARHDAERQPRMCPTLPVGHAPQKSHCRRDTGRVQTAHS